MRYHYKKTYEKSAAFFRARPRLIALLFLLNRILTLLFAIAYFALAIYAATRLPDDLFIIGAIGAFALCLAAVWVLRIAVDRARPYEETGAGISPLVEKRSGGRSFPSRHTACAFAVATAFLPLSVWLALPLYVLGAGLAYVRFVLGWHYPSDLIGGAAIGTVCGLIVFLF